MRLPWATEQDLVSKNPKEREIKLIRDMEEGVN